MINPLTHAALLRSEGIIWEGTSDSVLAAHPVKAVTVMVHNRGRMATIIQSWGIEVGQSPNSPVGPCVFDHGLKMNRRIPAEIEPGEVLNFHVTHDVVTHGSSLANYPIDGQRGTIHGFVTSGDGKAIRSKKPLTIPNVDTEEN